MRRSLLSAQRAFPIAMVVTLAIALLPGAALGWVNPLREITGLVLTPFTVPLNMLAGWLRPPPDTLEGTVVDPESLRHLDAERMEFERLYLAEQARADELEQQLQQLQNAPADLPRVQVKPLLARIALRAPTDALGEVTINRGTRDGVTPGTVAVYNHVHFIGWVKSASNLQSTLVPAMAKPTRVRGAVIARDRPSAAVSLANAPKLGFDAAGDGAFVAEPDKSIVINVGDEVVLLDEDWPASAQGLRIGTVESVKPNDKVPLRNIVTVRPAYQLSQVRMVVLRIESHDEATGDASPNEGDR